MVFEATTITKDAIYAPFVTPLSATEFLDNKSGEVEWALIHTSNNEKLHRGVYTAYHRFVHLGDEVWDNIAWTCDFRSL